MTVVVQVLYNLFLPIFCLLAAPAWILKMARRGGLSSRLWERVGIYDRDPEFESSGAVYIHAVSVGEVVMALKLISKWQEEDPAERFVLAATTSTGFQFANERALEGVRVIYSPVDFPILIRRLFRRFEPSLIVMVDSELWPNLLRLADRKGIPTALVNARLSPRSARRYAKFKLVTAPMLSRLKLVCAQAAEHGALWSGIGVAPEAVKVTGSIKFDPAGAVAPAKRAEFQVMLDAFGGGRPVVLATSTHAGEERFVAECVQEIPGALAVLLPRHAERRQIVKGNLEDAGFEVALRSDFSAPQNREDAVLVVDSTGEQRDWTAHADLVVIGKSFFARGGQNPAEAIAAGIPVVCGPNMQNFEPLISELRAESAVRTARPEELAEALRSVLDSAQERRSQTERASAVLERHRGATARSVVLLRELRSEENRYYKDRL